MLHRRWCLIRGRVELEPELSLGHVGDCENNYCFLQEMVPWMGQNNGLGELCLGEGLEPSLEEMVPSTEQSNGLGELCPGEELEHSLEVGEPSLRHDDDETSLVLELSLGHDDDESSLVLELSLGHDGVDGVVDETFLGLVPSLGDKEPFVVHDYDIDGDNHETSLEDEKPSLGHGQGPSKNAKK
ncbi:hypothetical protein GH714_034962 [Hevea brasiliensis]|uniref:Uncharacterized protein n=1 Tax=Hevea brasiliensis TaxID=3981 RepID=A0A6A6LMU1_HEVBR|nr:hypothetical protein GH714_034962 [Hevea brasiliensis]